MKLLIFLPIALLFLGLAGAALIRWAQKKHLQEMIDSEGLLRRAEGVRAAIQVMGEEGERWTSVDLYLSRKRICAFRSALRQPLIHVPFENSALEVTFASGVDSRKNSYLGLGAPSKQGEVRFFLSDAREWLCEIEQLNNLCHPETCENFDPALCGTCPAGEVKN